jgi:hypothetical protein
MAKTPIGDILPYQNVPKYAIAKSDLQTYVFKNGVAGLQPYLKLNAGNNIGYFDSWHNVGNSIYFIFYKTIADYNTFKDPYYVKYSDYKKYIFPTVTTWKNNGVDFGAISSNIQAIIDRDNKEAESLTSVLSSGINKIILIAAIYLGATLLIKRNNGN